MIYAKKISLKKTIIKIRLHAIGHSNFAIIAGQCSIESEEQIFNIVGLASPLGSHVLRGGAFKPRTSPYHSQGLGKIDLHYLHSAANALNLFPVSKVMGTRDIDLVAQYSGILQIDSRNTQNDNLPTAAGETKKIILLKRGYSALYKKFLMSAEYIHKTGNRRVILCERGIRRFETHTRDTFNIATDPTLQKLAHPPTITDPRPGCGLKNVVPALPNASIATKADGITLEIHTDPDKSISGAKQIINLEAFSSIIKNLHIIRHAINKTPQINSTRKTA